MQPLDQVQLRTSRLLLRPLRDDDAQALLLIHSNSEVARYQSRPAWTDISEAQEIIQKDKAALAAGEYLRLGLERLQDRRLIGDCSVFAVHETSRRAEVGYSMARDAWGQGYMHEALTAVLDFAFGALALNRLEADIDPRNLASAKSLERLGFTRDGYLRERWIVSGEVSDSALYGLLAVDWKARRSGAA
jgi:RimJ/RimL family protein N-acetyltransferase